MCTSSTTSATASVRAEISVFGDDYPTRDGAAREITVNLGTGTGYSVLEVIEAFGRAVGRPIPHKRVGRRPGDVAECWADPSLAQALLGWKASRGVDAMCADAWRWQQGLR